MSKSISKLPVERQVFSILEPILKQQLERQDEQGKALHTMYDSMKSMYIEMKEDMSEMKQMVQEVRDSVTLTNAECTIMHSEVATKSISLTKDRYNEEEGDFKSIVGIHRRLIWKHLRQRYDVPKYNCIRRIDFDEAVAFVRDFRPEDYM